MSTGLGGWIGVDLDGTLAHYDEWRGIDHIGAPVPLMVDRVKRWLGEGQEVRIFTARVHGHSLTVDVLTPIRKWCLKNIGQELPVTNVKDFGMVVLYDDRAVRVEMNTGKVDGE